jgi:hypothetical protein
MPSWNDILTEIQKTLRPTPGGFQPDYDGIIKKYVKHFSDVRGRNVIVYYSDWLNRTKGPNIDINDGDMVGFMNAVCGMDKTKGLDLIIHTPGGDPLATGGIVKYLHTIFAKDISIFVPHMAMSAGTMLACSGKEIWMGKQSSLGPIDPQFAGPIGGISAYNIKKEFEDAKKELIENPETFRNWQIILSKYPPAFYYTVLDAISVSSKLVNEWLQNYMFSEESDKEGKAQRVTNSLNTNTGSHSMHFGYKECEEIGLHVKELESDNQIQDSVLSIYHSVQICGSQTPMCKIITNQDGKSYIINGMMNGVINGGQQQ